MNSGRRRQRGQSMVEYTVVVVALVASLLIANQGCSGHDNCVAWLLDTLDNNYQGYSRSLTAVQQYGDYPLREGQTVDPPTTGEEDDSGGGVNPGTGLDPDGLTEASVLQNAAGTIGRVYADNNVVGPDGGVIGSYDPNTGVFTYTAGDRAGQTIANTYATKAVLDEEGNALTMKAVTDANGEVLGFGYKSVATGKFFRALDYAPMDLAPEYQVVESWGILQSDGQPAGGRIVGGWYYANTFAPTLGPQTPAGEVVALEPWQCAVAGVGWDGGVDTSASEEAVYAARAQALVDALIGYKDPVGVIAEGCNANRSFQAPD